MLVAINPIEVGATDGSKTKQSMESHVDNTHREETQRAIGKNVFKVRDDLGRLLTTLTKSEVGPTNTRPERPEERPRQKTATLFLG